MQIALRGRYYSSNSDVRLPLDEVPSPAGSEPGDFPLSRTDSAGMAGPAFGMTSLGYAARSVLSSDDDEYDAKIDPFGVGFGASDVSDAREDSFVHMITLSEYACSSGEESDHDTPIPFPLQFAHMKETLDIEVREIQNNLKFVQHDLDLRAMSAFNTALDVCSTFLSRSSDELRKGLIHDMVTMLSGISETRSMPILDRSLNRLLMTMASLARFSQLGVGRCGSDDSIYSSKPHVQRGRRASLESTRIGDTDVDQLQIPKVYESLRMKKLRKISPHGTPRLSARSSASAIASIERKRSISVHSSPSGEFKPRPRSLSDPERFQPLTPPLRPTISVSVSGGSVTKESPPELSLHSRSGSSPTLTPVEKLASRVTGPKGSPLSPLGQTGEDIVEDLPLESAQTFFCLCRICETYVSLEDMPEHSKTCSVVNKAHQTRFSVDEKLHKFHSTLRSDGATDQIQKATKELRSIAKSALSSGYDVLQHKLLMSRLYRVRDLYPCIQVDQYVHHITDLLEQKMESIETTMHTHSPSRPQIRIHDFQIVREISRGAFGRVFLVKRKISGDVYAMKVLRKSEMIRKNIANRINVERSIMTQTDSPWLVKLIWSFQNRRWLFLVMEFLPGGDLHNLLHNCGRLEEHIAVQYAAETVSALDYIHQSGIIHRDIKPDNLLISEDGHIKLIDFGLSHQGTQIKRTPSQQIKERSVSLDEMGPFATSPKDTSSDTQEGKPPKHHSIVGTPDYLAPEFLLGLGHTAAVDWWAVGCLIFEMLCGVPPCMGDSREEVFLNITRHRIHWQLARHISPEAKNLLEGLLVPKPSDRLGGEDGLRVEDIKSHPWFRSVNWNRVHEATPPFVPQLTDPTDLGYFANPGGSRIGSKTGSQEFASFDESTPLTPPVEGFRGGVFHDFSFVNIDQLERANQQELARISMQKAARQSPPPPPAVQESTEFEVP